MKIDIDLLKRIATIDSNGTIRIAGRIAGWKTEYGYRRITISGKTYPASHIAYALYYGIWPDVVDHINRVRDDNRKENLRSIARKENHRNYSLRRDNKIGICGIHRDNGAYRVRIGNKNIGTYHDLFSACCARKSAENRLKYHENHGRPL